jgi:two-component SAPR family response regulator
VVPTSPATERTGESRPDLEVRLLGPPLVVQRGEMVNIPRRKAQALLYYLISDQRAHTRDKMATLLWEESDDVRARRNLSNAITTLRRTLGDSPEGWSYILSEGGTLRFNTAIDCRLDVAVFEQLITAALKEVHEHGVCLPAACVRLGEAVDLYRGDLLEGFVLQKCLSLRQVVAGGG